MIIGVKGTRAAQAENPADAYVAKHDPTRSKAPLALGLALGGLVAYLKSMASPAEAAMSGTPPGESAPEASAPAPDGAVAAAPAAQEAPTQEAETGPVEPAAPAMTDLSAPFGPELAVERPPQAGSPLGDAAPMAFERQAASMPPAPQPAARPAGVAVGGASAAAGAGEAGSGQPPAGSGGSTGPGAQPPIGSEGGGPQDPKRLNSAPHVSGPVLLPDVALGAVLLVSLEELLRGAVDPDGDSLGVKHIAVSDGTLVASGTGWLFRPAPDAPGPVTITYTISDGALSATQYAHFNVVRPPIEGTGGDDLLIGTAFADEIDGRDGNDAIDAREGDDVVAGGAGDDHIVAGAGDDLVLAGAGDDIVFGGPGNDRIFGGEGRDRIFGEAGDDILHGEEGDDDLSGGEGDDVLFGGPGDDILAGGRGRDVVSGGDGDDRIVAALDAVPDVFDGGAGIDVVDYSHAKQSVTIDFGTGRASGIEIGEDSLTGFESAIGGAGDDRLVAGTGPTIFAGGGGANLFEYRAPADPQAAIWHEILDFKAGDTIRLSKWDIFERAPDATEDRFGKVYGDEDGDELPIRYRHHETEHGAWTRIEADLDLDNDFETTVSMDGHHFLTFIETC